MAGNTNDACIRIRHLSFDYRNDNKRAAPGKALDDINIEIKTGSRVLVTGVNGAGKSTLLSIIGGQKMIEPDDSCLVLNRPAFNDSSLADKVVYLGSWWRQDFFCDITISQCLPDHAGGRRFKRLCEILDINPQWVISCISDGQRRRCQLLANLIVSKPVYVLDEVTTDLDLPAREALMHLLREESQNYGATILLATHIFDTLENWPTHILHIKNGQVAVYQDAESLTESFRRLKEIHTFSPWFSYVREMLLLESREAADERASNV